MGPALPFIAIGASVLGGVIQADGQAQQARAASQAAAYNAQVSERNSKVALQNADLAMQAGNTQIEQQELKNRAVFGEVRANQGASGIDVGSGSFKDVRKSVDVLGQEDALNIRANAVKEAYGYQTQAQGYDAQGNLQKAESKNALTAGNYAVAGTLLGSASHAGSQWEQFKMAGAL